VSSYRYSDFKRGLNNSFSTLAPAMRKAAEETTNFGIALDLRKKVVSPCKTGTHEERRHWRLYFRRNRAALYELQDPHKFELPPLQG